MRAALWPKGERSNEWKSSKARSAAAPGMFPSPIGTVAPYSCDIGMLTSLSVLHRLPRPVAQYLFTRGARDDGGHCSLGHAAQHIWLLSLGSGAISAAVMSGTKSDGMLSFEAVRGCSPFLYTSSAAFRQVTTGIPL
jgi:hypothetical protein